MPARHSPLAHRTASDTRGGAPREQRAGRTVRSSATCSLVRGRTRTRGHSRPGRRRGGQCPVRAHECGKRIAISFQDDATTTHKALTPMSVGKTRTGARARRAGRECATRLLARGRSVKARPPVRRIQSSFARKNSSLGTRSPPGVPARAAPLSLHARGEPRTHEAITKASWRPRPGTRRARSAPTTRRVRSLRAAAAATSRHSVELRSSRGCGGRAGS